MALEMRVLRREALSTSPQAGCSTRSQGLWASLKKKSRSRVRIEEHFSGGAVEEVATEKVGAFAQGFEFASAVELVVSSRAGVVVRGRCR
jgi:hypothetical protein